MSAIIRASMKDQIYEIVKKRIFSQYYESGEEIKILTLSKELKVSNTPIREALTMLVAEGLLTTSLNNKFRVIELNEEMNKELNETINILLTGGYKSAHRSGKDKDLVDLLDKRLSDQREAGNKDDDNEYILKTLLFDRSFVEITGNTKLIKIFDDNNYLLYLYVRHTHRKDIENRNAKFKEHEELRNAVASGNSDLVESLIDKHYDQPYSEE